VFSPGRIVWKADGISDEISVPLRSIPNKSKNSVEWLIGEALTNLFVGLSRDRRGEKLSALRFIQGYAVDRILELVAIVETDEGVSGDRFDPERRFEERFPLTAKWLPGFLQGYERNRESAIMVLFFLEEHFDINPTMKQKILDLSN
jgi:hypothetical protein